MKIITGKKEKPLAILLYGIHGIGKTTFPMEAPYPVYIGSEENDEFDITRFPKVETWKDLEDQLTYLVNEKHSFQTLVIDTIDALEQIAQKSILNGQPGKTMATAFGGYGKAWEKMHDMFLEIRDNFLVKLRDTKNMNIVILAHAEKTKHEDPMTATTYDHYTTAIHKKIKPLFEDWVSAILFVTWQLYKVESADGKERATGDGTRVMFTEERPSHIAKNRFGLPFELEFPKTGAWSAFTKHTKVFYNSNNAGRVSIPKTKEEEIPVKSDTEQAIAELMKKVADAETKEKILLSIQRANGNQTELDRIYKKLEKLVK